MHAIIKDGKILLYDSYIFKESIKEISSRQWHPEEKAWSIPISQQNIETFNALEDIIDTAIPENKKLVVIARFIPEIKEICKMLDKKKIKYAHICGEVKDRAAEVDAFQNNPKCMVFVGRLQTVSMGLTLTATSTMVFYSLSYNFVDYSQAKARIHRIGQNVAPNCYSTDNRIGIGTPGGECAKCPYNKFGSGEDGQSKACKNAHRLYILRSGELYPVVVTIPPTSLKSLSDYLAKRIVTKGLRSYGVVTKLTLKKATNNTGIAYSQVQFAVVEKLSSENAEILKKFGESIRPITRNVDFMDTEEQAQPIVNTETGEVIQPLE